MERLISRPEARPNNEMASLGPSTAAEVGSSAQPGDVTVVHLAEIERASKGIVSRLSVVARTVARVNSNGDPKSDGDDVPPFLQCWTRPGASPPEIDSLTVALLGKLLGSDYRSPNAFLPNRKHAGLCRVCGRLESLSFEHFPPEALENDTKVRAASALEALSSSDPLAFPREGSHQVQRGIGARVLCGFCNSHSGTNFVPALLEFASVLTARVDAHVSSTRDLPGVLGLAVEDWELGDIARAGLVSVMAGGVHDRLIQAYPGLREVVLKGATEVPDGLRLGLTFIGPSTRAARVSPPQGLSTPEGECVFSEMAARPLAWTLCYMGEGRVPLTRTADVTSWLALKHGERSRSRTSLELPVGAIDSPMSGDFRPGYLVLEDSEVG